MRRKKSRDKRKKKSRMDYGRLLSEGYSIGLWAGVFTSLGDCDESHTQEG